MGKESGCSAGDSGDKGSILGSGRSSEGGNDNLFQYLCLGNAMDKGAWHVTVHEVTRVGHSLATKQQDSIYYTIENTYIHSWLLCWMLHIKF